jgi:hypothetical protein
MGCCANARIRFPRDPRSSRFFLRVVWRRFSIRDAAELGDHNGGFARQSCGALALQGYDTAAGF